MTDTSIIVGSAEFWQARLKETQAELHIALVDAGKLRIELAECREALRELKEEE